MQNKKPITCDILQLMISQNFDKNFHILFVFEPIQFVVLKDPLHALMVVPEKKL